jgi:cytochrome c-type biogenesis protein CcmH/NrfG
MSKVPQRRRAGRRRLHPEEQLQRSTHSASQKHLLSIALVVVLAGIPFALGKYIEFGTPEPYDGGGFLYSAWSTCWQ